MNLNIDKELQTLIPELKEDEYKTLEESCLTDGIREPIIYWNTGNVIIDGHNRYKIAKDHDISFNTVPKFFQTREEVMIWMIDNQRGRRNLSKVDWLDLGLKRAQLLEEKAKENLSKGGGDRKSEEYKTGFQKSEKAIEPINTTAEAAKFAGVSTDTASKYKKVMAEAPEEIKQEVKEGKKSINKAYQEIKKPKETNTTYTTNTEEEVIIDLEENSETIEKEQFKKNKKAEEISNAIISHIENELKYTDVIVKNIVIGYIKKWTENKGEKNE